MSELNFTDLKTFNEFVQNKSKGHIVVTHRNCKDYAGMVLYIGIVFDAQQSKYEMNLEWMCLGLICMVIRCRNLIYINSKPRKIIGLLACKV